MKKAFRNLNNSAIRRQARRARALDRFHILTKDAYDESRGASVLDTDYELYQNRKFEELMKLNPFLKALEGDCP